MAVRQALERASMYRLLGAAFAYPRPDGMEALSRVADTVASASAAAAVREAVSRFAAAAREAEPADIAGEYVFLFDRGARCPPYEGAYGDAPRMAGKAAMLADIAGFYAAFGLAPAGSQPDMADHVAAELEFMSALALKEAYALGEGDTEKWDITHRAQVSFLGDHLGCWAETFAAAVKEATPLAYYGALADLLETWVQVEVKALGAAAVRLAGLGDDPIRREDAFSCPMAEPEGPASVSLSALARGQGEGSLATERSDHLRRHP